MPHQEEDRRIQDFDESILLMFGMPPDQLDAALTRLLYQIDQLFLIVPTTDKDSINLLNCMRCVIIMYKAQNLEYDTLELWKMQWNPGAMTMKNPHH